ncbi:hypothetical protein [Komagataeibacter xylinus]
MFRDDLLLDIVDALLRSPQMRDNFLKQFPSGLGQHLLLRMQQCNHLVQARDASCRYNTEPGKVPPAGH